jgi:hypothetical protein
MGKVVFMVFTIKPGHVPSLEGRFHGEIDKTIVGVSLNANTTDNLLIGGTGLVFHKEIIFE